VVRSLAVRRTVSHARGVTETRNHGLKSLNILIGGSAGQGLVTVTLAEKYQGPIFLLTAPFMNDLQAASEVVCVEGNATAQFARLLRREAGFEVNGTVLRYDGLPFTPEFIVKGVEAWRNNR